MPPPERARQPLDPGLGGQGSPFRDGHPDGPTDTGPPTNGLGHQGRPSRPSQGLGGCARSFGAGRGEGPVPSLYVAGERKDGLPFLSKPWKGHYGPGGMDGARRGNQTTGGGVPATAYHRDLG